VDKDLTASRLPRQLDADALLLFTLNAWASAGCRYEGTVTTGPCA
jgi:carbamate kinase